MIGIYKITNKKSGKVYIGQSNDIQRRIKEHKYVGTKSRIPVDFAIQKYGRDAFTYEVVEECLLEQLNEREKYWEEYYDAIKTGYNCQPCGESNVIGEKNPNAKLTEDDVRYIRQCYANHQKQRDVYKQFKGKITFLSFQAVWEGRSWANVMPEVFTKENKQYYISQNSYGENGKSAVFSDDEVMKIRQRYITESAKEIYQDYKDRIKYPSLQALLCGRAYYHLPIYSKTTKQWIMPTEESIKARSAAKRKSRTRN